MKIFYLVFLIQSFTSIEPIYQDDNNLSHFAENASQPETVKDIVENLDDQVNSLYDSIRSGIHIITTDLINTFSAGQQEPEERILREKTLTNPDEDFKLQEKIFEDARQKLIQLTKIKNPHLLTKIIEP